MISGGVHRFGRHGALEQVIEALMIAGKVTINLSGRSNYRRG
jgi:hypothetical protein